MISSAGITLVAADDGQFRGPGLRESTGISSENEQFNLPRIDRTSAEPGEL